MSSSRSIWRWTVGLCWVWESCSFPLNWNLLQLAVTFVCRILVLKKPVGLNFILILSDWLRALVSHFYYSLSLKLELPEISLYWSWWEWKGILPGLRYKISETPESCCPHSSVLFSGTAQRNKHNCSAWSAQWELWGAWDFSGELWCCVLKYPHPFSSWGGAMKEKEEDFGKWRKKRFILSPCFFWACVFDTWLWWVKSYAGSVDFPLSLVLQRIPNQLLRSAGSILGICCGVLQEGDLQSSLQCGHA